jgi:hypothetical protein
MDNINAFPVSSQVLEIMIRAGASIRNPDLEPPMARSDKNGQYLEMRVAPDPDDPGSGECIRRISLDELSVEDWEQLQRECANLQLRACRDNGLGNELENITDERLRRIMYTMLTFLNIRQVAIVLYLYREAFRTNSGPRVTFKVNDLLGTLGYSKKKEGGWPAKYRSQLHRDLVALHRAEILYARPVDESSRGRSRTKLVFKSILRINDVDLNVPRTEEFDLVRAAEDGYGAADSYCIDLTFFDSKGRNNVLFADAMDFTQKAFAHTGSDRETKLIVLLGGQLEQVEIREGRHYVVASKRSLYKNLDLLSENKGRNNKLLWQLVENIKMQGYVFGAKELPGKKFPTFIEFEINPKMMRKG